MVIVPAVVTNPNVTLVGFIELKKFGGIVDNHGFLFGVNINQNHKPIIFENLKIIKNHQFTHFL